MSLNATCEEHDWSWDSVDDYGCPVCYGINIERERIIALLESQSLLEDACKESPEACSCHLLIPTVQFIKLIREQDA